ncbi:methyltransferase [Bacillus sp. M6-12]|uniref:RraA family protein n=1 Tax=Bacillus sp. M6-12 TaxID=2054166 RepID=UPI000C78D533|nr:RraA family protein [Bacillus sp. M6-12]PLS18606.1 methyltransferase [Bacillus sp. M6-12]
MTNHGFRILQINNPVKKEIIEKFRNIATVHLSDNMNRLNAIGSCIRPHHKEGKLLGTAITVKTRPGDNLMVHKAIDLAKPGEVLVVDAGGETTNAIVGEIMMRLAQKAGISGFVIDGAIRDYGIIKKEMFPVFAKGVTNRGPYKDGPGEINVPVTIGGMVINPGDIIVGDEDGLVAIPCQGAEEILQLAQEQQIKEEKILRSIENGEVDRKWVDEILKRKGFEFADRL